MWELAVEVDGETMEANLVQEIYRLSMQQFDHNEWVVGLTKQRDNQIVS